MFSAQFVDDDRVVSASRDGSIRIWTVQNGKMVLEGKTTGVDGGVSKHRISWTPNADGSVRQLWQVREAKGQWKIAFDGLYTRI